MGTNIFKNILEKIGQPELVDILVNNLNSTDLQSVMMEIYRRRAGKQTPKHLFEQYLENRFVQKANTDPITMMKFDQLAFSITGHDYEAIELSPVAPLGTNSVIAPVDQNNTIATIRNTEVCSDPTNMMALECAKRRKHLLITNPKSVERISLCSSHRVMRAQLFDGPGAFPHFRLFSLCTAGRDEGSYKFEINTVFNHVIFYLRLLNSCNELALSINKIRILFLPLNIKTNEWLNAELIGKMKSEFPAVDFEIGSDKESKITYYKNFRFNIFAEDRTGAEYFLVDGGFTDWTQQLLSNKKERLLTSGIGSERLLVCFG